MLVRLVLGCLVIALILAAAPVNTAQDVATAETAESPGSRRVEALQRERLEVLRRVAASYRQMYESGHTSLADVLEKQRAVHEAELDMASSKERRIAILEQMVENQRRLHRQIEARVEVAAGPAVELLESEAAVLETEIALARERAE